MLVGREVRFRGIFLRGDTVFTIGIAAQSTATEENSRLCRLSASCKPLSVSQPPVVYGLRWLVLLCLFF